MNEPMQVVLKEEVTLQKFEGDVLVERVTLIDGKIVNHEYFREGDN